MSLYSGRGCPAQCTFCLWPQTIGGHKYRVRSAQNVADEMSYLKRIFPQVREFFFDDDTFTVNLPRARAIAKKLAPHGLTWSRNSRANLDEGTSGNSRKAVCTCSSSATKAAMNKFCATSRRVSRLTRCGVSRKRVTVRA